MAGKRLDALSVREDMKTGKSYWCRVGTAFQNQDGGWTVLLDALPVSGKLVLKEPREKPADGGF